MKHLLSLLLVLPVLSLAACQSSPKVDPVWVEGEIESPSTHLVWQVSLVALQKAGYPVGAEVDPTTLRAISGWKQSLAPFRGQGSREQAEVTFTHMEEGRYQVRVRVRRERNMDIIRPLDPTYADWEAQADNSLAARRILQLILSLLDEGLG
jgi:hypothetical protein